MSNEEKYMSLEHHLGLDAGHEHKIDAVVAYRYKAVITMIYEDTGGCIYVNDAVGGSAFHYYALRAGNNLNVSCIEVTHSCAAHLHHARGGEVATIYGASRDSGLAYGERIDRD